MKYFKLSVLVFIVFINACSTSLNTVEWAKNLSLKEYTLKQDSLLVDINCSIFETIYGIQTEANYQKSGIWTRAGCNPEKVSKIEAGSKIFITDISMRTDASGSCWNVMAKELSGKEFFIPSCKFFHSNLWVIPQQPTTNTNLKFKFNEAYLVVE